MDKFSKILLIYRVCIATVIGFMLVILLTSVGTGIGKLFGLEPTHNIIEVILSFMSGGLVVLIYYHRLDSETRKEG